MEFLGLFFKKFIFRFWLVFAIILTIPSFYSMVRPGYFPMQDDMQAFKIYEINECWKDVQLPCRWSQNSGYGYGEPVFNFYSPFVYYVGEGFHLMGFQFIDSVKIVFILGFILSTFFAFLLLSEFFGPFVGFVGGLLYTFAPFRAQEAYVRGSLPEFFAVTLLPIVLLLFYRLIKNPGSKSMFYASLSLGILLLTHNLTAFIFAPVFLTWIIYWLRVEGFKKSFPQVTFSLLIALLMSSFFILPMIFEKNQVHLESILTGYFDYRRHFLSLRQIFFSNDWGYGSSDLGDGEDLALNSGLVILYLGLSALPLSILFRKKRSRVFPLTLILVFLEIAVLFLMHLKSEFIYRAFTPLVWLQFPWRILSVSILILTFLSGVALSLMGKFRFYFGFIAVIAVFILHGLYFHPVSWKSMTDAEKFSGESWEKQLTISIFDYMPKSGILPPNKKSPKVPEVLFGSADFINYEVRSFYQKGSVEAKDDSLIRFPMIDFPGVKVLVDGRVTKHVNNECRGQDYCFGLVAANIPRGVHNVEVILTDTPVRRLGNYMTVFSLLALIYLYQRSKHEKS